MSLLPDRQDGDAAGRALSTSSYWDSRYVKPNASSTADALATEHKPTHEWFLPPQAPALQRFLKAHLPSASSNPLILHLGSGDSTVPTILRDEWGYSRQLCLDFSPVVVEHMAQVHAAPVAQSAEDIDMHFDPDRQRNIVWLCADARDVPAIRTTSVDVAFDKGTLDALIHGEDPWDPPDEVLESTAAYLREVHRTLKPGATMLWVTFRQPHFVRGLLDQPEGGWETEMSTLTGEEGGMLEYWGWVLKKRE